MKINRCVCDKCGSVIQRGEVETLIKGNQSFKDDSRSWDLCPKCFEEFKSSMITDVQTVAVRGGIENV